MPPSTAFFTAKRAARNLGDIIAIILIFGGTVLVGIASLGG